MFDYNSATSLDAALRYVALGFHVFPCHTIENGICSCGDPTCPDAGKHPLTDNGFYGATNDPDTVRSFFSGPYSIANVAIRTGGVSGVWVTDVDDPAAFAVLEARYGPLPKTWTVQTGSGGRHVYFRFADGCEAFMNSQRVAGCFDVRGDNGYVLAPPSLHRSGQRYRWLITPDDCELAIAPAWLTGLLPKRESLRPLNPTVCKKSFSDYSVTGNGNENGNVSASAYVSANVNDNASANVSAAQPDTHTEPEPARASETGTGTPTYTVQRARTLAERMALYLAKAPIAVSGNGGSKVTWSVVSRCVELFGVLPDNEFVNVLETWNRRCLPSWTETELRRIVERVRSRVASVTHPLTDAPDTSAANTKTQDIGDAGDWPTLHPAAYHGLLGEIVSEIEPHTEADPAALLVTLLTFFGCAIGRNPFFAIEGDKHHANLFACIVGDSSRARKGTSLGRIRELFVGVDDAFTERFVSGLSSGEGLISAVRDGDVVECNGTFSVAGGVDDKRLLVIESELASVLKRMRRETNTLSTQLRDAWDRGDMQTLTKGSPLRCTDAHVSIIAHITQPELIKTLDATDAFNGFANRFLWTLARRSKRLPDGGGYVDVNRMRERLRAAIVTGKNVKAMERDVACRQRWRDVYEELVEQRDGLWDAVTSRAEAQTLRLSMLFALASSNPHTITSAHLDAALAVWRYCDDSARILFTQGVSLDGRLRSLVYERPGIMRSELRAAIPHGTPTNTFDAALRRLLQRGDIVCVPVYENRQAERYYPGIAANTKTQDIGGAGFAPDAQNSDASENESDFVVNGDDPVATGNAETHDENVSFTDVPELFRASERPEPLTLAELLNWRNEHAVKFRRDGDRVWVTPQYEPLVTEAIAATLTAHQDTIALFVPADDGHELMSWDEFTSRLRSPAEIEAEREAEWERWFSDP